MPASERQIESNRRNAAGPHKMTEAGKQAIRANAVLHGLTSHVHIVLAGEDQQFFNELRDSLLGRLRSRHHPGNSPRSPGR